MSLFVLSTPRGSGGASTIADVAGLQAALDSKIGNSFETVSKNLRSYPYVLSYTSGVLTSIVYTLPDTTTITKTFNYTLDQLTSIVLSGTTPSGISLTKTFGYTGDDLTSIGYS